MRTPEEICQVFDKLRGNRGNWENHWQETAENMYPMRALFRNEEFPGQRRRRKIFDNTPERALDNFAAGIFGMMTNPASKWYGLKIANDPELNDFYPLRLWTMQLEQAVRDSISPEASRFYAAVPTLYKDWHAFGTGIFYNEERPEQQRIYDTVRPLSECYFAASSYEEIDVLYRKTQMTVKELVDTFGDKVSTKVRTAFDRGDYLERHPVIHAVEPNKDFDPNRQLTYQRFPFSSHYIEVKEKNVLAVGGYEEFPFQIPRWEVGANEIYGRSPGVIDDVRMLHEINKSMIIAAQRAADPPLLAYKKNRSSPIRMYAGGITYDAVTPDGRQKIHPLFTGAKLEVFLQMLQEKREQVKESMYFSLMQLAQRPNMTATEVLERQEEKLRLLGPNLGRLQSEFLSPFIQRRVRMLDRMGKIPPMPELPPGVDQIELEIVYVSPLARAIKSNEAAAVGRLVQGAAMIAEVDPNVVHRLDTDEILETLADGYGVPVNVLRSRDDAEERANQQRQMDMLVQASEQAPKAARAVETLVNAGGAA